MIRRLQFRAMGTDMLACVDADSFAHPGILDDVPNWFEVWEQSLSRFRPASELARLNRSDSHPVRVSDVMWQVLQAARNAERFSDGLVTPTVLASVVGAGYDRDFATLPPQQSAPVATLQVVSPFSAIEMDEAAQTVSLPPNMQLDFGGIAKGWAAHQAMLRLSELGPALMNCGGDIAISGALRDGRPWEVGVYKPFDRESGYLEMLYFDRPCGVATSSTDRRRWMQGGQLRHHIIDPRTGEPARSDVVSATVVADTLLEAETAAKSVLIRGSEDGLDWLESHPSLAALLVLENEEILYSQRIVEYL